MLTGQTITRVFIAGAIVAVWGMVKFFTDLRVRPASGASAYKTPVFSLLCVIYILAIYYLTIFSEPLARWDARSIWFFHAKMIWTEGALRQQTGWNHPSLGFSHPDYPKLVPTIAAQLAYLKGYWNEFLPKGSLLVMLLPLVLWVFSFRRKSVSFILLVLVFFFSLGAAWLSNGLMDGYLIMYCGAALLLFGLYLSEGRDTDLYSGVCASGIAASLKNEGVLLGLCLVVALVVITASYPDSSLRQFARRIRTDSQLARTLIFSIAPTIMWTISTKAWGLQNDIAGDPSAAWSRLSNRLVVGFSPQYVLNYLAVRAITIWVVMALLGLT